MCGWLRVLVVQNLKEACRLPVRVQKFVFSIKTTLLSAETAGAAARNGCGLKCWRWPAGNQQVVLIKSSPADDGDGHGPGTAPVTCSSCACESCVRQSRQKFSESKHQCPEMAPAFASWRALGSRSVRAALPSRRSWSWKMMS